MELALQIAGGIWLGGLMLAGTVGGYIKVREIIERNNRYGYSWRHRLRMAFSNP